MHCSASILKTSPPLVYYSNNYFQICHLSSLWAIKPDGSTTISHESTVGIRNNLMLSNPSTHIHTQPHLPPARRTNILIDHLILEFEPRKVVKPVVLWFRSSYEVRWKIDKSGWDKTSLRVVAITPKQRSALDDQQEASLGRSARSFLNRWGWTEA